MQPNPVEVTQAATSTIRVMVLTKSAVQSKNGFVRGKEILQFLSDSNRFGGGLKMAGLPKKGQDKGFGLFLNLTASFGIPPSRSLPHSQVRPNVLWPIHG